MVPGWCSISAGHCGEPTVICALYEHIPVAVSQEVWNALRAVGRGAYGGGTHGVGFPAAGRAGSLPSPTRRLARSS